MLDQYITSHRNMCEWILNICSGCKSYPCSEAARVSYYEKETDFYIELNYMNITCKSAQKIIGTIPPNRKNIPY